MFTMMSKSVFVILTICAIFVNVESIGGGQFITITDVPYFVNLVTEEENGYTSFCGGTIISDEWILTAGHCIFPDYYGVMVRTGSHVQYTNGTLYEIEEAIMHGSYEIVDVTAANDIALLKLKKPIQFNEYRQPIKISSEELKGDEQVTIIGLGRQHTLGMKPEILKKAQVTVESRQKCRTLLSKYKIPDTVLCLESDNSEACMGDSGGPAIYKGKVVGIASTKVERTSKNCMSFKRRGKSKAAVAAYTRVSNYFQWISKLTGIDYV